jgi:hypothetical protein
VSRPIVTFTVLVLSACGFAGADVRVGARPSVEGAKTYQRLEWDVQLDRKYDNPFDPRRIAVDATFVGPQSQTLSIPAFWRKDRFVVRFAPPAPGPWKMSVTAKDGSDARESATQTFVVTKGDDNGFVRRTPGTPRYFQFDSGKPYFVLGLNIAWAGKLGLAAYETWFTELSKNGGNFARVWVSHPGLMTETVEAGIGRYDEDALDFYDRVLDLAQQRGVYCMVTFNNYRDLRDGDEWGAATWPRFPYNRANGGPATRPADFFTNEECRRRYRQRLRYIAARWSAYTSVAVWEFWNEQTNTRVDVPTAWTREMAQYLRAIDPYDHLISTSFGEGEQADVWTMPEIDLTQSHLYPGEMCEDASLPVASSAYTHSVFAKPHLVSEFGIGAFGSDAKSDPEGLGTNTHNGIWAGMISGASGGGAVWWWDNYIHSKKLWHVFAGPAAFAGPIPWNRLQFEPLSIEPPSLRSPPAPQTFSDIVITSALPWGRAHGETIRVLPNGQATRALPQYLYGPRKMPYRTPTALEVDLPRATKIVLCVAKVSDHGTMRVLVNGEPKQDFFFSALPGAVGQKKTARNAHDVWEADFDQNCAIELPAGRHQVVIDVVGGDWISLRSVTIVAARSSSLADLHVLALQDTASGETIAWLRDPASNWQRDLEKSPPRTVAGAVLRLPVPRAADYDVEWWDTRSGRIVGRGRVAPTGSRLELDVPPVHRDIALRVRVAEAPS